jgi:hypothetical protein
MIQTSFDPPSRHTRCHLTERFRDRDRQTLRALVHFQSSDSHLIQSTTSHQIHSFLLSLFIHPYSMKSLPSFCAFVFWCVRRPQCCACAWVLLNKLRLRMGALSAQHCGRRTHPWRRSRRRRRACGRAPRARGRRAARGARGPRRGTRGRRGCRTGPGRLPGTPHLHTHTPRLAPVTWRRVRQFCGLGTSKDRIARARGRHAWVAVASRHRQVISRRLIRQGLVGLGQRQVWAHRRSRVRDNLCASQSPHTFYSLAAQFRATGRTVCHSAEDVEALPHCREPEERPRRRWGVGRDQRARVRAGGDEDAQGREVQGQAGVQNAGRHQAAEGVQRAARRGEAMAAAGRRHLASHRGQVRQLRAGPGRIGGKRPGQSVPRCAGWNRAGMVCVRGIAERQIQKETEKQRQRLGAFQVRE